MEPTANPQEKEMVGMEPKPEKSEPVEPGEKVAENPMASYIKIHCAAGPDEEMYFRVKSDRALISVKIAFAKKIGRTVGSLRFCLDGDRIPDDATPASLGLEEGAEIEVFYEVDGGQRE